MYVSHKNSEEKAIEQQEHLEVEQQYKRRKTKVALPIILLLISLAIAVGAAIYEFDPNHRFFQTLGIATKCKYEGKEYQNEETFKIAETCMMCTCSDGGINCDKDICDDVDTALNVVIEDKLISLSKQDSIEIKSANKIQKNRLYIATLDKKSILLYFSDVCDFENEHKMPYKHVEYLDNTTFFSDECISSEGLSDIYELLSFDGSSNIIANSSFYDVKNDVVYASIIDNHTVTDDLEISENITIDSYIYKFDLKKQLATLTWEQKSSESLVNTKYAYLSNKSNSHKLLFSIIQCADCEIEDPSEVYLMNLENNKIEDLGRIYVKNIDKNNIITYQKYVDQFYYPIDNLDAKNFYCNNNPDYWCGDGQSVWSLYEKIYTKNFD